MARNLWIWQMLCVKPKDKKKGNAPNASESDDAPKNKNPKTQSDLLSKTADVPIQTNQSLSQMRVRARAAEGKRIEVADNRERRDRALIAREKRHIVQQQLALGKSE